MNFDYLKKALFFFWEFFCKALLCPLRRFIVWQGYALYYYLDPIASRKGPPPGGTSKHVRAFAFSGGVIFLAALYGNLLLPYLANVRLTWTALFSTPALLIRQIFPRAMWPQTDIINCIANTCSLLIYASFWAFPWTIHRYGRLPQEDGLYLRLGKNTLTLASSQTMLNFHRRIKSLTFASFLVLFLQSMLFFYVNLYLNDTFGWSGNLALVYFFFLPGMVFYIEYALLTLTVLIILAAYFFQITQKDLLKQLTSSNAHLEGLKGSNKVLSLCRNIEAYAIFWRPSLTVFFLDHITCQTYLLYTIFILDSVPFLQKSVFLYMVINVDLVLLGLISFCAQVVRLNRGLEVANRHFYLLSFQPVGLGRLDLLSQLKLEALATSGRLRPYAFRLFDNYRITSRTFYLVLSDISLFFVLILQKFKKL